MARHRSASSGLILTSRPKVPPVSTPIESLLTLSDGIDKVRLPTGSLDPWPFVSQGSGRASSSRSTRLGSRVASGGSPRPLRKEARQCGLRLPRRPWAHAAVVATAVLALVQIGCRSRQEEGEGAAPPKVQETVGDLSFVVSRGEWKVEGVGLVGGLDNTGADRAAVVGSQATRRRDDQGRRRARREAAGEPASSRW